MKKNFTKIMYALSILMLIIFIVFVVIDYANYNAILTSAPFYVNILVRAVEFLIPSLIFLCVGYIYRRKHNNR